MGLSRHHRSNSNHRCCYDFRFRDVTTHEISDSSKSFSATSSTTSNHKPKLSSSGSKNYSSSYGCSQSEKTYFENVRKRHRPSSPALSPRKSRRLGATIKNGRDDHLLDGNSSSPVVRFLNGGPESHVSVERSRDRGRSISHVSPTLKRKHGGSDHHSSIRPSHKRKRQRRSKERAKRRESHEHHKRGTASAVVPLGEVIKRRFEVRKVLGEGSFGQVLECLDLHTRSRVAVKALKRLEDYQEAAKHEVDVLDTISKADRSLRSNCIETIDFFDWHRHYYIVFPLLSTSVFNLLERNDYEPYPIDYVIAISRQLCEAVDFMHKLKICHTDLKPENIMFVSSEFTAVYNDKRGRSVCLVRDPRVKVIDFGSAVMEGERRPTTIQTRHYRAPEVILECGWSYSADVWSVGCIIYELVTGQCLFMTHDNLEHLAMMERFLGPLPKHMVRSSRRRRYFRRGRLDWDVNSADGRYVRRHVKPLGDLWLSTGDLSARLALDLVREMLVYDPDARISPQEALEHPFFQ
ncbi:Dual specificity protein kinase CLK2 [Echinococcus granulosus]|uniref:Dual specificity protein kinase CLK2 n=1 Tax=Echinococcus granulosus TaxID=6210 RepID=U6J675_ECHGR|nr:Dual specificity protein kinase CLK2 [Echinococcus granulosus]EUB64008.1 Dual specificity protein kinase CLK2 [Echinococcus granulosus]KAH9280672.1 Dual specificity protein kinase CLK2 [Echinococcus granulosus]CDS19513.1 dual specificity protein kinase clk2 [Echinococcus granulosus]